ncbi:ABC transporter permease [Novosphingobium colocasiae]|uniref:ABC transporter permease n=1 Tax=Novosphingobium colocasiae TaxID=1256513 RepID=UPI0035AFFCDA
MAAAPPTRSAAARLLPMIAGRIASSLLTLFLVSVVIFVASSLLPGDAAQELLGQSATPAQIAALRHEMGLDQPGPIRFVHWLGALLHGDPGVSFVANMPVSDIIANRLPNSLLLAAITALISIVLALTIGIASAINRGGRIDSALNIATLSLVAIPEFLIATLAVLAFSVKLLWLPSISLVTPETGWAETLRALALPVLSLTCVVVAQMARMTRAAVADQLDRPYVEMARLKGVPFRRIVLFHVMPNAIGPVINAMALSLSYLMGGALVVETIFNYPGLASLMVNAVTSRDMPLLQSCAMIFCATYLALMLVADIVAILANPRLRA